MDRLLKSCKDLIESGDLKKLLKAIEQTHQMPEDLALGFFEAARKKCLSLAGVDGAETARDHVESAIAGSPCHVVPAKPRPAMFTNEVALWN